MNKIILFDIDYTLINTDLLRKSIEKENRNLINTDISTYEISQRKYISKLKSSTDFNPENYTLHLSKIFSFNQEKLLETFYNNPKIYLTSLYEDCDKTLNLLSKSFNLGIFSEGLEKFQITKLKHSGILKYFNKKLIFIYRRKLLKHSISSLPKKFFIVDDKVKVVEILSKSTDCFPIWINRKDNSHHPKIPTIFSLKDSLKLLSSN